MSLGRGGKETTAETTPLEWPGLPQSRLDASQIGLKNADLLERGQMKTGLLKDKPLADRHFLDVQATLSGLAPIAREAARRKPDSRAAQHIGAPSDLLETDVSGTDLD